MGSGAAGRTGMGPPSATGIDRDPRPHFAQNVIHLLRGEFAEAWKTHPKCLQEPEDIAQVREWIEGFVARQPEQANAHLVLGLFLAQSGQSEQSIVAYKESITLAPQSAYPHYFLAQIHERASHLEMAIKRISRSCATGPFLCAGADQPGRSLSRTGPLRDGDSPISRSDQADAERCNCLRKPRLLALAEQGKMEPALQSHKEGVAAESERRRSAFCVGRPLRRIAAASIWRRRSMTRPSSPIRTSVRRIRRSAGWR